MKTKLIISFVIMPFILASCATIIDGANQSIDVTSDPEANVEIVGDDGITEFEGNTPATVELPREKSYTVTIKAENYKAEKVKINQSFNNWMLGNIICGGIPGGVVDAITGAMWELKPHQISVSLENNVAGYDDTNIVAVFRGVDENGQLYSKVVPLEKKFL